MSNVRSLRSRLGSRTGRRSGVKTKAIPGSGGAKQQYQHYRQHWGMTARGRRRTPRERLRELAEAS